MTVSHKENIAQKLAQFVTVERISENNFASRWQGVETLLRVAPTDGAVQYANARALRLTITNRNNQSVSEVEYLEREQMYRIMRGVGSNVTHKLVDESLANLLACVTKMYLMSKAVERINILSCPVHREISLTHRMIFPVFGTMNSNHYGYCRACDANYVAIPASYNAQTASLIFAKLV